MNPYSLFNKIKNTEAYVIWDHMLGESENAQAEKAARFLRFIESQSIANPDGATAEFARNLRSLLRPGADSRIDLASAYAGLEGMLNEILNQLPSVLGNADCRKALKYKELCNSKKYREEVLAPYQASVRNFNPNSMLGEIILCMAVVKECRQIKKDQHLEKKSSKSDSALFEDDDVLCEILSHGCCQFYYYKLYKEETTINVEQAMVDVTNFLKSHPGQLVSTLMREKTSANVKDFGLKIKLFAISKYDTKSALPLLTTIDQLCDYRNKLNHGAFHTDEVKELTSSSRTERKKLALFRKYEHADAAATMLIVLIMLVNDKSDIKISKTQLLGYKMQYYASYAPIWAINRSAMLGAESLIYVVPKLISFGIPAALLILAFSHVGQDMTPKYLEPEHTIAAYDAMLDGDTNRLIAIRDKEHFTSYNKSTRAVRETKPASQTTWRLYHKPKKEYKNGRNLYSNPSVDFYPMQSQLDDYMKTQLRILANEAISYADGNPLRLGVGTAATSIELEHNPELHNVRYAAVEAYLKSILPSNITIERLDRDECHVSVDFYIIPNET